MLSWYQPGAGNRVNRPQVELVGCREKREVIRRGHQVDGASHQRCPHRRTILQHLAQLIVPESIDPAPQREIGILHLLRLQPGQGRQHIPDAYLRPLQQVLSLQVGTI